MLKALNLQIEMPISSDAIGLHFWIQDPKGLPSKFLPFQTKLES